MIVGYKATMKVQAKMGGRNVLENKLTNQALSKSCCFFAFAFSLSLCFCFSIQLPWLTEGSCFSFYLFIFLSNHGQALVCCFSCGKQLQR